MKVLTVENEAYDLDFVPDEIQDIRYCVLDYSDKDNADYIFVPLVFLESFSCPAAVLKIGKSRTNLSILISQSNSIFQPDCRRSNKNNPVS